jgi:XTP/dITP diphosphohydrolase
VAEPTHGSEPPLLELVEIIGRLRRECAWKASQTHLSLTRYLLEESYEAVEAIESGSPEQLRDELGDVLLQVYLHAAIAEQAGQFDIEDVAAGLREKMIRRNPHVFGDESATDPELINQRWQQIKATEGTRKSVEDGVPLALPALLRAVKVLERLETAGVEVPTDPASADLGERLLALADEARRAGMDPEQALRQTLRNLVRRHG